ncbi:MAG: molybdopterin-dependent oxidoreductase [Proteobacteria bacterium]|nr:molybdopterin-dependent oxidoreductase [Pseudomonadota bacterium]
MKVRTVCRCCSAGCAIVVAVDGARVVDVKGDKENPRTHGYICPKGHSLGYFHHRADRLDYPTLHGRPVGWGACLDDLAGKLRALITQYGPDSVGVYQGTGAVSDTIGLPVIERFIRKLGSEQFHTAATVDVAPALRAADLVCGTWFLWPVWIPEDEDNRLAIYLGSNPAVSNGYLTMLPDPQRRIRAFRRRGGKLWVIDPRRTQTAALADRHLPIRPGSDAILLAWLIRELLEEGADHEDYAHMTLAADRTRLQQSVQPFTLHRARDATGLDAAVLLELLSAIRVAGRCAVVAGTGITFGEHALLTEWLRWVLLIVTGSLDRRGGMWFNPGWTYPMERQPQWAHSPPEGLLGPGPKSRPELPSVFGQRPAIAIVDEIEARNLRALLVCGSSPLTAFPEPQRTEAALRSLDVLVSIDVVATPLTAIASHVLPSTGQMERADFVAEVSTSYAAAVVPRVAERRPMWWMLRELGRRLDVDVLEGLPAGTDSDDEVIRYLTAHSRDGGDALIAAGSTGLTPPRLYGWLRERGLPQGRWRLLPPGMADRLASLGRSQAQPAGSGSHPALLLVNGRQLSRTNSTDYVSPEVSRDLPRLRIHPQDAAREGLQEGDRAVVASSFGRVCVQLHLDDRLRPGVVSMSQGWHEANVAHLTSARRGIDPLTTQPQMTALPVSLTRVA